MHSLDSALLWYIGPREYTAPRARQKNVELKNIYFTTGVVVLIIKMKFENVFARRLDNGSSDIFRSTFTKNVQAFIYEGGSLALMHDILF